MLLGLCMRLIQLSSLRRPYA
ncbi:hypothetical protein Goarm_005237, partial [Gossypium armourianum]|nr:hypothetical protein [Gossypium armourianum]